MNSSQLEKFFFFLQISEGEGAENLAVEQMHKEKMVLEETVNRLNEVLKSLNISHENTISQHDESWKEKIEVEKEKVKKLENELNKLHCNYISAVDENKKVCNFYIAFLL